MNKPHSQESKDKMRLAKIGKSNAKLLRPTQQIGAVTLYRCGNCSEFLPKNEFYPSRTTLIGITSTCKPCNKREVLARRNAKRLKKLVID